MAPAHFTSLWGVLRLALGELAVAAGGPGHPGRVTLAAVGAREVDAAARAASSRILALIHVHLLWAQTLALCGAVLSRRRAGAAVAAASVLTHSVPAVRLIQALIHVHALQQVAIVVETLLAVALVARLRVHAFALLADLCPKQYAFVDVTVGWNAIVHNVVVLSVAFPIRTEAVKFG